MTPNVTITFVVGLTYFMTKKGHEVNKGRHDLIYDPKGQRDLCAQFDLIYDLRRLRGH